MLTGERIWLRAFQPGEFKMVQGWFKDPVKTVGPNPYWLGIGDDIQQTMQSDSEITGWQGRLAIELLDSQKVIGVIRYYTASLVQQAVEFYEIGYAITDPGERRKGYAREACALLLDHLFETYQVRRVGASTLGANEASARLLEGLGFIHEGAIRQAAYIADQWTDLFLYGMLREEWIARRRA